MSTKSRSKLSCKVIQPKTECKSDNDSNSTSKPPSTPSNKNLQSEVDTEYSPIYFPMTQDMNEEIDVIWNWHSPQSTYKNFKKQKRLPISHQSPKFPIKRHPSHNNLENVERLRRELRALQEELSVPDDESCLCVSPQQEVEFKAETAGNEQHCDDLFNDSIDEQLILVSQQIENEIKNEPKNSIVCDDVINKYKEKSANINTHLKRGCEVINNYNRQNEKESQNGCQRDFRDFNQPAQDVIEMVSGKLEFFRTKSFELEGSNITATQYKCSVAEIERKRLEAKAKLESKRKKDNNINTSPMKCSPEEIEKKRLQALAKLEAKRLQDIVEKKRQEALKKLQKSRMKNACQVKSELTKRL